MKPIFQTNCKLIALILLSTFLIFLRNTILIGLICGVIIILSSIKMNRGTVVSRMITLIGISSFVVLFQLIFNQSDVVFHRLLIGCLAALRLIALSLLVLLFTETTSASQIISSLSFLPEKVVLMLTISFSLIPTIFQEISAIRIAQQARGFSPRGINMLRSIFPILIPLLNRTLTRAEHIAIILQTKGFE
jgi:energy-coupling factor transporter transmembrane protein EcfT